MEKSIVGREKEKASLKELKKLNSTSKAMDSTMSAQRLLTVIWL